MNLNSTSQARTSTGGSVASPHTVVPGNNRAMYALTVAQDSNHGNMPVLQVEFNGNLFTKIGHKEASGNVRVEIWKLDNPGVTTADVNVDFTGTLGEMQVFVIVLNEADGYEATADGTGTSTSPQTSITTLTPGAWILSILSGEAAISAPGSGQTRLGPQTDQSFENGDASYEEKLTPGADTQSFTLGSSEAWAMMSVAVKPKASTGTTETDATTTTQDVDKTIKSVVYKFYDSEGNYISSLSGKDFVNLPEFTLEINGGLSELNLQAAFRYQDWRYPADGILVEETGAVPPDNFTGDTIETVHGIKRVFDCLKVGNRMKVFINDKEGNVQIWSGIYAGMELEYSDGGEGKFIHNFIPNFARLASQVYRAGDVTTVEHVDDDPADIFRDVIDALNSGITYSTSTINDTGVARSYSFKAAYASEALRTAIQLTPNRWFWFVGGDDLLYLRNIDEHATQHRIPMLRCKSVRFQKSISFLRNRVLFLGGGTPALYGKFDSSGSQNEFGVYEEKMADESVSDSATAAVIANRFLADRDGATSYFQVEVLDSNFSKKGYDIEAIKPGDEIIVTSDIGDFAFNLWGSFVWGVDYWLYNFYATTGIPGVVQRIHYKYDTAVYECSFNFDQQSQRIEQIDQDLTKVRFDDVPDETNV